MRLRRSELIPRATLKTPWRTLLPAHRAGWISAVVLLLLLGAYVIVWCGGYWGYLSDPMRQTDDARTLFYLHQHGSTPAMADDPIAREMQDWVPPAVHLLYRVAVPAVDLFWATKIMQLLCLLLVLWAAVALLRSRHGGLGAAALLLFGVLHSAFMLSRIAGGLPRAFAFPCLALWVAGAVGRNERLRWVAAILSALTYPSAMAIILAAEGIFLVSQRAVEGGWRPLLVSLKRYAVLIGLCLLALAPYLAGDSHRGPTHTLAEARQMPGFKRGGRVPLIPLSDPIRGFSDRFNSEFKAAGQPVVDGRLHRFYRELRQAGPLVFAGLLLLLVLLRVAPAPKPALALLAGAVIVYLLARIWALRLYDPSRYYEYAVPAAVLALTVSSVGLTGVWLPEPWRATLRQGAATLWILLVWSLAGSGVVKHNTLPLDGRRDADLYRVVRRLPGNARIATHPWDGDNLPFWAARPTTGGHETFQPWCKGTWRRQVRRFKAVVSALYATRRADLLTYCQRNQITHLLLRRQRYGPAFKRHANFMEPVGRFIRRRLARVHRSQLVLSRVPPAAVIWHRGPWQLVEVARLKQAWAEKPSATRRRRPPGPSSPPHEVFDSRPRL